MSERRRHTRIIVDQMSFHGAFRLADGSYGEFRLGGRNLSRGGVAVVCEGDVEVDTPCQVVLPTAQGEIVALSGTVRSTRMSGPKSRVVAIEFDQPMDQPTFDELATSAD